MKDSLERKNIKTVYEDEALFVVFKPAGLAVETKRVAEEDLESILRKMYPKDSLSAITRLDQPVSGLVLIARTKEAAAALSRQLNEHKIKKMYRAFVSGSFSKDSKAGEKNSPEGFLKDYLVRDAKTNTSRVVLPGEKDYKIAKEAILFYREVFPGEVEIDLKTGRHHQIRVQLANAGHPILGDYKYGNATSIEETKAKGISQLMLFAEELTFFHPSTGEEVCVRKENVPAVGKNRFDKSI